MNKALGIEPGRRPCCPEPIWAGLVLDGSWGIDYWGGEYGGEELEEWLHGRSQGEWVSDVSSDQEIICREERKSGLSLPARGGRKGFRVFLCACYCCVDTGALKVVHLATRGTRLNLALWILGHICTICGHCSHACIYS